MKLFLFTFFVLPFQLLFAQNVDSIGYILDSTYASAPFFGTILISKNNQVIFEKSYGYADAVSKKTLTKENSFQIASISKQFTAYGIMILKSKGLLQYDSMVCKYLPTFPYKNITIRHLLNHTSGLPNFWDDIRTKMDTTKSFGNNEVLAYLIQHQLPLQYNPGTKFQYADIGYDFLALVIEHVSGMSYQKFMQQTIFEPLKMNNTFALMVTDIRRIQNNQLAYGHAFENGTFTHAHLQPKYNFVSYLGDFYGDGSVVSTARDLAIWDEALKKCNLLPCEIQNEAFEVPTYNGEIIYARTNPDIAYGFGWFLKNTPSGKLVYHSGGHPGNSHVMYRLLDKDITFIFLSNAETSNLKGLRNRILQMLF
ncbi:MAG: beta-lactamase family protein [Bacteroidetes bacterium]|nr:beta-lactamase family protein [Bacteroidota bacterium]MBK9800417.1 beta-lactamase family protein [Bacteroidota bacterium]MBP6414369.1 beta-lactamase family protein [Bacteroidia bacterium]